MSYIEYLENDIPLIKNEIILSDLNIYNNEFILKEVEKNDEMSFSEESNFQSFIKREFLKEMTNKNFILENEDEDDDFDDTRRYEIINYKKSHTESKSNSNSNNTNINNISHNCKTCVNIFSVNNTSNILNTSKEIINRQKIFNISKIPKNKKIFQCLERKREYGERSKKFFCDWDNIKVPKEKHFHFDRKKHRIVFQRKHLKVIYSIVDLTYPFDFNKCFNMIKQHIGDKTVHNYGSGKSFHIIKINNEEKIVTLKDKKLLLRENKIKRILNDKLINKDGNNNKASLV